MGDDAPRPKYLVVNADEMEPGTFKDRLLLEGDPHQLIEGMIIGAYAIEADVAYIFLRGRTTLAAERLAAGHRRGLRRPATSGKNILGSGFSLELHLHVSAGRYMCGEETGAAQRAGGQARHPAHQAALPADQRACGASRPSSTTSRRSATCRTSSTTAPSGSRA